MRRRFEFFARCLGLILICAGILLGIQALVRWTAPAPDSLAFWNRIWDQIPARDFQKEALSPFRDLAESRTQVFLAELVTRCLGPLLLGLALLRGAPRIAGFCYPEGEGSDTRSEEARADGGRDPEPGSVAVEDGDRRFAPPGYAG